MFIDIEDPRIGDWIREGKIFIYPTDTVYGLGCDASNVFSVNKIREIKGKKDPLSIIAPGKAWIKKHCECGNEIEKLPGPFTFLYKSDFKGEFNNNLEILGVRIPNHEFSEIIEGEGIPFITTSVNKSGEKPAKSVQEIPQEILKFVDFIIDDGPMKGNSSTIIDYSQSPPKVIRS
jgi:L-threonylcarbamoyladenylate synthase